MQAQFRFYWIHTKFEEKPEISSKTERNRYPFLLLPVIPCVRETVEASLMKDDEYWNPLDGLLFYHKQGFYTPKVSPLVGWLKPFMIPEVLKFNVSDSLMQKKPISYVNIQHHLSKKAKQTNENRT